MPAMLDQRLMAMPRYFSPKTVVNQVKSINSGERGSGRSFGGELENSYISHNNVPSNFQM
jgi:hypothetical protein